MKLLYSHDLFKKYCRKHFLVGLLFIMVIVLPIFIMTQHFPWIIFIFLMILNLIIVTFINQYFMYLCKSNEDLLYQKVAEYQLDDEIDSEDMIGNCTFPPMMISKSYIYHNYLNSKMYFLPYRNVVKRDGLQLIYLKNIHYRENGELAYVEENKLVIYYLSYRGTEMVIVPALYKSSDNLSAFVREMQDLSAGIDVPLISDTNKEEEEMVLDVFERHDVEEIDAFMEFMRKEYGGY